MIIFFYQCVTLNMKSERAEMYRLSVDSYAITGTKPTKEINWPMSILPSFSLAGFQA